MDKRNDPPPMMLIGGGDSPLACTTRLCWTTAVLISDVRQGWAPQTRERRSQLLLDRSGVESSDRVVKGLPVLVPRIRLCCHSKLLHARVAFVKKMTNKRQKEKRKRTNERNC